MSSPLTPLWPCYSCCQQIWIPQSATFGDGCTGIVAFLPIWISLFVLVVCYGLRPFWRRRPVWLRNFAAEQDEMALKTGGRPLLRNGDADEEEDGDEYGGNDGNDGNDGSDDDSANADNDGGDENSAAVVGTPALEATIDGDTNRNAETGSLLDSETNSSSIVGWFARRNSIADVRPVVPGGSLAFLKIRPWHLMSNTVFLLSLTGIITSLSLTFAASHGFLYLTPLLPCVVACFILAWDRPRTLPFGVFIIHLSTFSVQLAFLFGVPELSQWPLNLTWFAEMAVTGLSLGVMMVMPLRDPRWGSGGRSSSRTLGPGTEDTKIAAPFETPTKNRRSPEDNLNLWRWMTVSWMAPLIGLGATRQLHDADVWILPFEFQHARLYRLFHDVKGSVTMRVLRVNAPDLIITSALGIVDSLLSMLPIILLKQLLAAMEGPNPKLRVAIVYAVLICISNLIRAQAGIFALWFTRRSYERSRGELITMIYEKTLRRKAFTFPSHASPAADEQDGKYANKPVITTGRGGGGGGAGGGSSGAKGVSSGGGLGGIANSVASASSPASTGKILNLMRNDVYEVAQRFWEFPTLFTKPLNFALSMFLLWRVLGAASLFGILIIVLAQVINVFIVRVLVKWEMARRAVTDLKLQITSQFIESIRHLRWYDWQDKWLADILSSRQKELRYRVIANIIQKGISVVNQMAASFFPVAAFYAYTVIEKRPLTIDVAFPALNLFNLLEQSLRELPDLITVMLNANVSMRRITAFMNEPDKDAEADENGVVLKQVSSVAPVDDTVQPPGPLTIRLQDASFAWPAAQTPVLSKVTLTADGSGLTVICGKVGSGKTALLMALLGEMDQHSGTRSVPRETVGYCAQLPWLQSMSIRENILFCAPFDEQRYNRVVDACCLTPDFEEFESGDLSNIGENGIGLSGGQKARVALARAVYSRARLLFLDDPIAALDHNTAESIMRKLFDTSGLMRDRLVVFVTHRMDLVAGHADSVYELSDEGGIVSRLDVDAVRQMAAPASVEATASSSTAGGENECGTAGEIDTSSPDFSESQPSSTEGSTTVASDAAADPVPPPNNKATPTKFMEEERRAHGGVMLSVYWRYIQAGKLYWWLLVIVGFAGFRISKIAYLYYLKVWGEAYGKVDLLRLAQDLVAPLLPQARLFMNSAYGSDTDMFSVASVIHPSRVNGTGWLDNNFGLPPPEENVVPWLFWFAVLALSALFFRTFSDLLLIVITYVAGKRVFQEAMIKVSTAPFRFFDVTPVGRLMNRVTSDIGTIDGAVAQQIHRCAWFMLTWLSSILVIATATPTFLVMAVFMTLAFVFIFFRFLPASQSLRRLEMVSLSPLMSNFGTLLEGLTTVRAFRAQPHFQERIIATTDAFQRMDHFYWSLQAWLQWRFNALTALSTFALTMTALAGGLSSGLVAFVLTAAANFVNATQVLCRRYGELQMQFVSVERVMELLDLECEPVGNIDPPAAWPTANDDIIFDNVTVRYAPHLEPSLRNVTMRIPAGSTVAVTGRTGSGKSTLALTLLGTILPENNQSSPGAIYIGSMNVATVNKHALRQRITFVAQDPVLFPGSLRQNLDPIGEHSDEECDLVLRRVLGEGNNDFTLRSRVDGGGKNMSQGQRQLIGLGRAVLRRSPIVILDEATASIDKKTAYHIQEVLREELHRSTVITIAHRLEAVRDADFSVVLENGRLIYAAPVENMA